MILYISLRPHLQLKDWLNYSTFSPCELTVVVELVVLGSPVSIVLVLVVEARAPEHGPPPAALLSLHLSPKDDQSQDQELCLCLHVVITDTGQLCSNGN